MKILLVEGDEHIARPIIEDLRHQMHGVDYVIDGVEGWEFTWAINYNLILLDMMLPQLDGVILCRRLRANCCHAHVLMIVARDTTSDKVLGLDTGADDYLNIAPEQISHVFDRCWRAELSRNYRSGGSGLGGAIAQAIAQQYRGTISVSSELEKGTCFGVRLPACAASDDKRQDDAGSS